MERLDAALAILKRGAHLETAPTQETLGLAGSIYKQKWLVDGQKQHLETSFRYYYRGHRQGVATSDLGRPVLRPDAPYRGGASFSFGRMRRSASKACCTIRGTRPRGRRPTRSHAPARRGRERIPSPRRCEGSRAVSGPWAARFGGQAPSTLVSRRSRSSGHACWSARSCGSRGPCSGTSSPCRSGRSS
jgi:hypothetical protein